MSVSTAEQQTTIDSGRKLARFYYLCCLVVLLLLAVGWSVATSKDYLNFGTLWASGRAAANGLNPYAVYPETHREDYAPFGGPNGVPDLNLNPPCVLPLLQLLSHLSIHRFTVVWIAGVWLCLALGITLIFIDRPLLQKRQILWLSVSMPPLLALSFGQVYGPLFLLSAVALFLYERNKKLLAAVAIGILISIRPTMAVWPLFLFITGHRKVAAVAMSIGTVLYALPVALYGEIVYRQWFLALDNDIHWMSPANIGFIAVLSRIGFRLAGVILATAAFCAIAAWVYKYKTGFIATSGAALCIGILCAPIGWSWYILFAAPFFVARKWDRVETAAALAFFLPVEFTDKTSGIPELVAVILVIGVFVFGSKSYKLHLPAKAREP